jgi:hypothetical protein
VSKQAIYVHFSNILYSSPLDEPLLDEDYRFIAQVACASLSVSSSLIDTIVPTNAGTYQRFFWVHLTNGTVRRLRYREAVNA